MKNPRTLLILFAVAFLAIQVIGFISGISKHEERMAKLEKQLVLFETKGTYADLKSDPAVKLKEEKSRFKAETMGFTVRVLIISGASAFVYALMKNDRKKKGR
ncbi:MAG: hypothetical protein GX325_07425 [Peptococcaceae bacterium]|nr:hypothetical protein [Peptococcaceae bacterium]